ncbi:MAG: hypothetical protein QOJ29_1953 [Thermoleophilaceae bacterium]|jgi:hypothetical protein|nr:hypothetical protein [Thermoleophilaceae bacterium]
MLRVVSVLALTALAIGGCGGGDGTADKPAAEASPAKGRLSEAEREAEERKQVPGKRLSAADRVAYYQIATTSGLLRARAATVLSGVRGTPKATLQAGRDRLDGLKPDSKALTALRGELAGAIDALLKAESRVAARSAIKATTAINADLTRFSKGKAVRLLVPD